MTQDVFISYSSDDKVIADAVVAAFETNNLRCWVAPRDIKPGADWGDSITKAIEESKIVLLIFSGNANRSKRVLDEIYYAISEEKIILPFRIENLDPTGAMRLHLASRHWLDAYQPSWQSHINQLINSAADSLGRAPAIPAGQGEPPAPVIGKEKKEGRKVPVLWIGLTVVLATILSVVGFVWFGSRNAAENKQPTAQSAMINTDPVTPTITLTSTPQPTRTSTPTTIPPLTLNIVALIDGKSQLVIKGDSLHWYHVQAYVPAAIYINGQSWGPTWPNEVLGNLDCLCNSSSYIGIPTLARKNQTVSINIIRGRSSVKIIQQPNAINDYTLIIEFDDSTPSSAAYEISIGYLTP